MRNVHNGADILDSRDVIDRIEELETEVGSQTEDTENYPDGPDEELTAELKVLKSLADEASGSPDWPYGETLIRDSYFEDYARELAEDIGAIDRNAHWPNDCIDWEKAAEELQQDYTSVDYDGVTYWIRS